MASEYTLAAETETIMVYQYSRAPEGSLEREIWNEKMKDYPENQWRAPFDYSRLNEEKVGTLMDQTIFERDPGYPCQFWAMRVPSYSFQLSFPANKAFDLLPIVDVGLRKLKESGTLEQIMEEWKYKYLGPLSSQACAAEVEPTALK